MSPRESSLALAQLAGPQPVPVPNAPARPVNRDAPKLLAELHDRHATELLRFCRWMLKDADDAADALQDTWIRAMTALGDDTIRVAALRPWLYAIARNVCLDRLRDRQKASMHELDEASAGDTPSADEVASQRQEAAAALALVGKLSERQRSALLMRELAGMSVPDIAQALGLTVDRAAWTIADARRALDEARAGSSLECDDARVRLGAGHRGRTLRAHLEECGDCRAHDRKLRARRVLAPALLPIFWLRRLSWPALFQPATATLVAAMTVTNLAGVQPAGRPDPAASRPAATEHVEVTAAGSATAAPSAAPRPAPVASVRRAAAPAPGKVPVTPRRVQAQATVASPTPAPSATAAPVRKIAERVNAAAGTVVADVRRTAEETVTSVGASVGATAGEVAAQATGAVDALR